MNFAYDLGGAAPIMKKFRLDAAVTSTVGGYLTNTAANGTGLVLGLTTTVANQVGSSLDVAVGTDDPTLDADTVVTVCINPLAVYRFLIVKGATGGQIDILTESVGGDADLETITTGETAPNGPTMDEGTIVCVTGANRGQARKITAVGATTAGHDEDWVNNNAIGDVFVILPWTAADVAGNNINPTTNLVNARADITVGTGADFRIVELQVDTSTVEAARNQSYVYAKFDDIIWGMTT